MLKATLVTDNLRTGITFTHHAISSRSSLPILLNFLIEAKKGKITISATDLEIGIQATVPGKVEGEGKITVSAKTFLDLINSIEEEKIELEEKEGKLHLKTKGTRVNLAIQKPDEYPVLFEDRGEERASLSRKELEKSLSRVVFAAAQDSTRPALSGVLLRTDDDGLSMVATDGYRLSLKSNKKLAKGKTSTSLDLLVSARLMKEVLSAKKEDEDVRLFTSEAKNQVIFEFDNTTVVGRLIEAEYPDYGKIIPEEHTTSVSFDRAQALSAVRSCSVIAREAANIVRMSIHKKDITFSATATSAGENEVVVDASLTGDENEIAFNARYLIDLLSNITEDNVVFEMTGPLSPGVFRVEKDNSFLHLIMPIRVQE